MSGLKGNVQSLRNFSSKLREFPRTLAIKIAAAAAPKLTDAARETFNAGENAYGITWAPLESGHRATLNRTGGIARGVYYVAIGTILRVKLGVLYAKYVLGKRPIFPTQGSALPPAYVSALASAADETIRAEVTL